ncbi:Transmembrane protein 181 [Exaiptasia diaphana]|nr:Transmembrane protein 181 [Exaiptasia diaphana]
MAVKDMESTVQMRLYTLTKRQFVMVFVAFIIAFSCSVFIGIAGPPIISSRHYSATKDLNIPQQKLLTGPFKIDTGLLSSFSQQIWLLGHFNINGTKKGTSFSVNFKLGVDIRGRVKDTSYHWITSSSNRTRHVKCNDKKCSNLVILHLGYIDYPSYAVQVKFKDLSFPSGVSLIDVVFTVIKERQSV